MSDIETFIKSVPEFKESRLSSLYSNFEKNKILNPEGYEANIYAWQTLLLKLITSSKFPDSDISFVTLTASHTSGGGFSLVSFLSISKYGAPQNLGPIINELVVHRKVFIPYSLFINGDDDSEWGSIINPKQNLIIDYLSPGSWIKWGVNSIFSKQYSVIDAKTGNLKHDRFIAWEQLTKLGDQYLEIIRKEISKQGTYSSKLFNNHTLYQFLQKKLQHELKKIDFEIFLKYWSLYKSACMIRHSATTTTTTTTTTTENDTIYIKFDNSEITNDDIGIINIQQSLNNLQNRNEYLQTKLNEIDYKSILSSSSLLPNQLKHNDQQVQQQQQQRKLRLKNLIKRKKTLTKSLMNSLNLYDELNNILVKINDSDLNYQIYHQLLISSKILQNMNNKVNLNDIDDLKIDIDEQIAKENEINNALTNNYANNNNDDEEEEEEEEELEKEELENELYKEINEEISKKQSESQQLNNETKKEVTANDDDNDDNNKLIDKLNQLKVNDTVTPQSTKEKQAEPIVT